MRADLASAARSGGVSRSDCRHVMKIHNAVRTKCAYLNLSWDHRIFEGPLFWDCTLLSKSNLTSTLKRNQLYLREINSTQLGKLLTNNYNP